MALSARSADSFSPFTEYTDQKKRPGFITIREWLSNRKHSGGYADSSTALCLCVIPIVTTCILLAVSLVAANKAFVFSAILPVVPIVATAVSTAFAAFVPAGVCHSHTGFGVRC
jgi:hypothetical protein